MRTLALIAGGILFSALAALFLARGMTRPIGVLQEERAADRRGRARPRDRAADRRRARGARRAVQQHDRAAARVLRRPRAQGRRAHAELKTVARAADRDQRDPARDLGLADRRAAGAGRRRRARGDPVRRRPRARAAARRRRADPVAGYRGGVRGDLPAMLAEHVVAARPRDRSPAVRPAIDRPRSTTTTSCRCSTPSFPPRARTCATFGLPRGARRAADARGQAYGTLILCAHDPGHFRPTRSRWSRRSRARRRSRSTTSGCSTRRRRRSSSRQASARSSPRSRVRSPTPRRCSSASSRAAQRLFDGKVVGIPIVREDGQMSSRAYRGPERARTSERIYPTPGGRDQRRGHRDPAPGDPATTPTSRRPACRRPPATPSASIGVRAGIFAPMFWEGRRDRRDLGRPRDASGPSADKEIALLRTFANQAVIAIQNARLVQRDARGARPPEGIVRGAVGHLELGRRHAPGVRQDPRELRAPVRRHPARHPAGARRHARRGGFARHRVRGHGRRCGRARLVATRSPASRSSTSASSTSPTATPPRLPDLRADDRASCSATSRSRRRR